MRKLALLACALLAACGGDDDGGGGGQTQANNAPAGNAPAPKPPAANGPKLTPRTHVEDLVACPTPETATGNRGPAMSDSSSTWPRQSAASHNRPGRRTRGVLLTMA